MALKSTVKTAESAKQKTQPKSSIKTGETKTKKGKGRKRVGKKAKQRKPIDWADEKHFDKNRALIYIEHSEECPIFKEKAIEFENFLKGEKPDKKFALLRNAKTPRNGAFEIYFSQNAKTPQELIWSGIEKGPPRKMKFPNSYQDLMPTISNVLKRIYIETNEIEEEEKGEPETLDDPKDTKENAAIKKESAKSNNVAKKKKSLTKKRKTNIVRKDGGAETVKLIKKKRIVAVKSSKEKVKTFTRKGNGKDGNILENFNKKIEKVIKNHTNTTSVKQKKNIIAKKIPKQISQSSTPILTAPKKQIQFHRNNQSSRVTVTKKNYNRISPSPRILKSPSKSAGSIAALKRVLDAITKNAPLKK